MRLKANDRCWCGGETKHKRCHGDRRALACRPVDRCAVSPPRAVPPSIAAPDYVSGGAVRTSRAPQIHDAESLGRMRRACAIAAEVLWRTGEQVAIGRTTDELDAFAHETCLGLGAYPSTLHYNGFTKSICTSVNGVICHGIPDGRPLADGDIVNIDVTTYVDGMHGDNSATFPVGDVCDAVLGLVETAREATLRGIAAVRPDESLRRIGDAIEPFAASRGYGVVAEYGGHGIGATFHADPHIHHCVQPRDGAIALPGMTFTVEPMLTTGSPSYHTAEDGWTEHTDDAFPSAQFEQTVLVTETGAEILTITPDGRTAGGTLAELSIGGR